MRRSILLFILSFVCAFSAQAGTAIQPTTTLAAETGNNTSAANSFAGQSNGNMASGNVSKLPIRQLLYPGATTKIYAHMMPWFGTSYHANVGYDSSNAAQAQRQVDDMVSRGIDGLIIDWYGQNNSHHNTSSLNLLRAAEQYSGFELALMEDAGAVSSSSNPTQQTINDLNYAWQAFMQSKSYMRRNGRPVVFFFGYESLPVNLDTVKSALSWNPLFIIRNAGGFTSAASDGAFAWLSPLTSGYDSYQSIPYLQGFYSTALGRSGQLAFGSGFKGFNDTIASWAPAGGRHINQFCGQTWLNSFATAGRYYSASNQLGALQIVTWNDYEEGSAMEPGIDNCVAVSAWMSSSSVNWAISGGQENTIDHYTVFISSDGSNLMPVANVGTGTYALDLAQFGFPAGTYKVFVKAVGKPSISNKMSAAITYTANSSSGSGSAGGQSDWTMTLSPGSVTLPKGGTATMALQVQPVSGAVNSSVSFECKNLPSNLSCSFSPSAIVPGASGASTMVTVKSMDITAQHRMQHLGWLALPALGIVFSGTYMSKRRWMVLLVTLGLLSFLILAVGCGGGGGGSTSQGTYSVTISATSGATVRTAAATVIVN